MSTDCDVCRGSRQIRVAIYPQLPAKGFDENQAIPLRDLLEVETSREYPCPECGDYAPFSKLIVLKEMRATPAEYIDRARDAVRRNLAAVLGDFMMRHDLIAFEERKVYRHGYPVVETRARVGALAPKRVAKFEDRVNRRQFEVAEAVVAETVEQIANWGSVYRGRMGGRVEASQAVRWLRDAIRRVQEERARGR